MLYKIINTEKPEVKRILSVNWTETKIGNSFDKYSRAYVSLRGLRVLVSIDTLESGNKYLHVSVSLADRIPTWDELREVKDIFIGKEKEAFQFLPKQSEYQNICKTCLHLWHCLSKESIV